MTDLSSKGLLPQLTELLNALSSSHALLLRKVQGVRQEQLNSDFVMRADSAHAPFMAFVGPREASATASPSPSLSNHEDQGITITQFDDFSRTSELDSSEIGVGTEFTGGQSERTTTEIATPAPSNASNGMSSPHEEDDVVRDGAATEVEWPSAVSTFDGANRNYNFFDELDARLADLDHSERVAEDHSNPDDC